MFTELHAAVQELETRDDVRAIILTGSGRGFCAGLDLDLAAELPDTPTTRFYALQRRWAAAIAALRFTPIPVIAAVNGPAAGRYCPCRADSSQQPVRRRPHQGDLAGQCGRAFAGSGDRAGKPKPGTRHPHRRHDRGARGVPGETRTHIHRGLTTASGRAARVRRQSSLDASELASQSILTCRRAAREAGLRPPSSRPAGPALAPLPNAS